MPILTADVQKRICQAVENGHTLNVAAMEGGVTRATLEGWLEAGVNGDLAYTGLVDAIQLAGARAEKAQVERLLEGGRGWQSAMAWLERQRAKSWSKVARKEVSFEEGLAGMSDEQLLALERQLEAKLTKAKALPAPTPKPPPTTESK
jgi:hypothetical protein